MDMISLLLILIVVVLTMALPGFCYIHDETDDIDDRLPMVPDDFERRIILNQSDNIVDLRGQLR